MKEFGVFFAIHLCQQYRKKAATKAKWNVRRFSLIISMLHKALLSAWHFGGKYDRQNMESHQAEQSS
jgi:hypothetical protein